MKPKKYGFTMVELLTVIAIIAILVSVLVPSLTMVRRIAKETRQKTQFAAISMALTAFRNDYGDYPPSNDNGDYAGAQKLAEALLGWDLMGFHPDSDWQADGKDIADVNVYENNESNLKQRRGPYLNLEASNAFTLGQIFSAGTGPLDAGAFVMCDVFTIKAVTLSNGKVVKAGMPILYYKANVSSKNLTDGTWANRIYDARDNLELIKLDKLRDGLPHKLSDTGDAGDYFYNPAYKVIDPKIGPPIWPHRPGSYILISAGADSEYGTDDDICNF